MTLILSIDPGGGKKGETGIALGHFADASPYTLIETWAVPDNIDGFREWFYSTWVRLDETMPENPIVVCEKWVDRGIRGADRSPMLIEGAVRFLWPDAVLQPASGKNTAVSDDALKNLGVYTKGGHHRDITEATRHAVWFLKNRLHRPTIEVAWPK